MSNKEAVKLKSRQLTMVDTGFVPQLDAGRIAFQRERIKAFMADSEWRTLGEISSATSAPEASASACLRSFRNYKFGRHTVEKRRRGDPASGHWEYRVIWKS